MAKRKRIILRHGEVERLAEIAGVSRMTVTRALNGTADTCRDRQNFVGCAIPEFTGPRERTPVPAHIPGFWH